MLYSFDIFDTLIGRVTDTPHGIFYIMQEKLTKNKAEYSLPQIVCDNFADLRIKSEVNARRFNKYHAVDEVTIEDIYSVFISMTGIEKKYISKIMDLEYEMEKKCIYGIDKNIRLLKDLKEKGEHVILISDMYISERVLRDFLITIDGVFIDIPLYVSCDYGMTKSSGMLYMKVKDEEKISFTEWIHYGDNPHGDCKVPQVLGITTHYIEKEVELEWEKGLKQEFLTCTDTNLTLMLGIAKHIIRNKQLTDAEYVGMSVVGPIFYSYIKWIIDICERKNIKNLYFIARDGYSLKCVADKYICNKNLKIKTKYIYGSRKAWRVDTKEQRKCVEEYILQELELKEGEFAFVDIQGIGTSMEYLADILNQDMVVFYYFVQDEWKDNRCKSYIYADKKGINLIEALCRAPHGTTIGYTFENEKWQPKVEKIFLDEDSTKRLNEYLNGIEQFADEVSRLSKKLELDLDFRKYTSFFIEYIFEYPSSTVKDVVGNMPQSQDNESDRIFAPVLTFEDINAYLQNPNTYQGYSFEYSLKRSGEDVYNFYVNERNKRMQKALSKKSMHEEELKKKKIILYGAGKRGQRVMLELSRREDMQVVAWCDLNYESYQKKGLPVTSIAESKKLDYDYIVIAIAGNVSNVAKYIEAIGIERHCIITSDDLNDEEGDKA